MNEEGAWNEEAVLEVTRSELSPSQQLLGAIIAQAAMDCRTALKRQAMGKEIDMPVTASACRFFLSEDGQAMIHACGLGHDGVRAGLALARTTARRLGIDTMDLLADSEAAWSKVVNKSSITHAPAMNRPQVARNTQLCLRLAAA